MKIAIIVVLFATTAFGANYFPADALDKFHAGWYSTFLSALHEEPLIPVRDHKTETYRFTWLRTFNRPVVIRMDTSESSPARLTIKVSDGEGGYEPGKLVRDERRELTAKERDLLRSLFEIHRFFNMPAEEKALGADGAEWMIEAVRDGRYHVVRRWSPPTGSVHDLGMKFIELAIGGDFMPIY